MWVAAIFAAFCLVDALRCVLLGHADWWFPTGLAFVTTCLITADDRDRG